MEQVRILKNKVVVYSILISLFFHILVFFALGKIISLKKVSVSSFTKPKAVFVTIANTKIGNHKNSIPQQKIKKENRKARRINEKTVKSQPVKKKYHIIKKAKNLRKIKSAPLENIPKNIIQKKLSNIENSEKSINIRDNIQNDLNVGNQSIVSDSVGYKNNVKIIPPDYKINKKPIYPRAARIKGYQGTVYLKITLNSEGRVIDSKVERSSGYSILDRAALKASYKWYFKPAYINNNAVSTIILVPVKFKLTGKDNYN